MNKLPLYLQIDTRDCGPTCLRMVFAYFNKFYDLFRVREICSVGREGTNLLNLKKTAEYFGFEGDCYRLDLEAIKDVGIPIILFWEKNHFVVLKQYVGGKFIIYDPQKGKLKVGLEELKEKWLDNESQGLALVIFHPEFEELHRESRATGVFDKFFTLLTDYKGLVVHLLFGLLIGAVIEVVIPLFTQVMIDKGVQNREFSVLRYAFFGYVAFFVCKYLIQFLRSWILMFISTRVNIKLIDSFVNKLLDIPFSYFESHKPGDILQRYHDHNRIETFISSHVTTVVFSLVSILFLALTLAYYNPFLLGVFLVFALLYYYWTVYFLPKRKKIDVDSFANNSSLQSNIIQILNGYTDIKISNLQDQSKRSVENNLIENFNLRVRSLIIAQLQSGGAALINEVRNLTILFLSIYLVVHDQLSIGALFAIQLISAMLISPIESIISFVQARQDAQLSNERINEIKAIQGESETEGSRSRDFRFESIHFRGVNFSYPAGNHRSVFNGLDLTVKKGKVTAIVGASGSGKTTIVKLLLKLYNNYSGDILVGNVNFSDIEINAWRAKCGAVLQDGYIFNRTIRENIVMAEIFDQVSFERVLEDSNLYEWVNTLPLREHTEIGQSSTGISQGQKQRILLARALYKGAELLLFDEATNALDSKNENSIMRSIYGLKDRTIVIVAHRLSTVRDADTIIVMDAGAIVERGSHEELLEMRGFYYELFINQIERSMHEK